MNSKQILACLKTDPILNVQCVGVFPLDKIPSPKSRPECLVVNLDTHDKPGSHWVAMHINQDGFGELFDSYGRYPVKKEVKKYLNSYSEDWNFNSTQIQSLISSTCGQYCIYFLYQRVRGVSMSDIVDVFSNDLNANDSIVSEWVNRTFNVETNVCDFQFLFNQCSFALQ